VSADASLAFRLVGGLGNQLFIYAAGVAVTRYNGYQLELDRSALDTAPARSFELDAFRHFGTVLPPKWRPNWLAKLRTIHSTADPTPIRNYDPGLWRALPGDAPFGYFQTWRYAETIRTDLQGQLSDLTHPSDWFRRESELLQSRGTVIGIHMRRGDYEISSVKAHHGLLREAYFRSALQLAMERVNSETVFLFSDDVRYAEHVGKSLSARCHVVRPTAESRPLESLLLMASTQSQILSNSSFSWWGSWISRCEGPRVAPFPWYPSAKYSDEDLIPTHWERHESLFQ